MKLLAFTSILLLSISAWSDESSRSRCDSEQYGKSGLIFQESGNRVRIYSYERSLNERSRKITYPREFLGSLAKTEIEDLKTTLRQIETAGAFIGTAATATGSVVAGVLSVGTLAAAGGAVTLFMFNRTNELADRSRLQSCLQRAFKKMKIGSADSVIFTNADTWYMRRQVEDLLRDHDGLNKY